MARWLLALVIFASFDVWTGTAWAPGIAFAQGASDSDQRAQLHYQAAVSYFEEESFEQALVEFRSAHRLSQRPELLYNIGLTLERLGRWDEAAEAHQAFLDAVPGHPDADEARARLERSRSRAEEMSDDEGQAPSELVEDPGPAEAEGSSVVPWVVLGASGAVGVAALAIGLRAHAIHGDLEDDCPAGVCAADRQDDIDRGQAVRLVHRGAEHRLHRAIGIGLAARNRADIGEVGRGGVHPHELRRHGAACDLKDGGWSCHDHSPLSARVIVLIRPFRKESVV